jgi:probable HAF family extracellular repeat protein
MQKIRSSGITLLTFIICMLLALSLSNELRAAEYEIIDLGTLGGDKSEAYDINSSGQVTGYSRVEMGSRTEHAFLWESGNGMTDLKTLAGGTYSFAKRINDSGQVVGNSTSSNGIRAFLWESGIGMKSLGTLGSGSSKANDINNSGQVVGNSLSGYYEHGFLWESGKGMTDLYSLPGGSYYSIAEGINDAGQVAGHTSSYDGSRAFLWESGIGMMDLGTLGSNGIDSHARAINASGQVVGQANVLDGTGKAPSHAFMWESGSGMTDLGIPPGSNSSYAFDINDSGQVVGNCLADSGLYPSIYLAFIWEGGTMTYLKDLLPEGSGWWLERAWGINNAGQIVGSGINPDGNIHAYLLSPVSRPDISVDPVEYDFGDVVSGSPSTMIAVISNVGGGILSVEDVSLQGPASFDFMIQSSLPAAIAGAGTLEIEITCDPSSLFVAETAVLEILNDDPDPEDRNKTISLTCTGVLSDVPSEAVTGLLDYTQESIDNGTLEGDGSGNSAEKRLNALTNMIESAGDLIDVGSADDACDQLEGIYKKVDGMPNPPDFVTGDSVSVIAESIDQIIIDLECQ